MNEHVRIAIVSIYSYCNEKGRPVPAEFGASFTKNDSLIYHNHP